MDSRFRGNDSVQKHFQSLVVFILTAVLSLPSAVAQELSYDRFAPVYKRSPQSPSGTQKAAAHFLVYPFELVRWPMDQSLVYIEKHHIDKKVQWIYDQIEDQGITPRANVVGLGSLGGGAHVDFIRLLRQKEHFPDTMAKSWFQWTHNVIFEVGSKVGMERIADTGFQSFGAFKYENRPEEHFYGIGPDTSRGEGTSYRMEATTLEPSVGYNFGPTLSTDLKFSYRNINITNGEDGGRGQIDRTFSPQVIHGTKGDELIDLGAEIRHDTRNRGESSTMGGQERVGFSYHEGLGSSEARYFKYEVDASRYFRLGSDRRVLAVRFYGEHNDETDNKQVPFHQMAKLGGYGSYPRLSYTHRAFDFNRFFDESAVLMNLEYRYNIWEYRDYKLDAVFFWDEGQVFGEFSEFQFRDLRESYGLGFRVSVAGHVIFAVETAHGDEGTNLYVRSSAPF